jgi:hypothetical protein
MWQSSLCGGLASKPTSWPDARWQFFRVRRAAEAPVGPTTGIGQVADGVFNALVVITALNVIRVGVGASVGEPPVIPLPPYPLPHRRPGHGKVI